MEHKISELISKYDSSQDELQIESQRKLIEDAYQRDAAHERRQTADFPKDAEENRSQYSSRQPMSTYPSSFSSLLLNNWRMVGIPSPL